MESELVGSETPFESALLKCFVRRRQRCNFFEEFSQVTFSSFLVGAVSLLTDLEIPSTVSLGPTASGTVSFAS